MTFDKARIAKIAESMDGLYAYDTGSTDSGVHNEVLRASIKQELLDLPGDERRRVLVMIVAALFVNDDSIEQGYGVEDIAHFIQWLDDEMGLR